MTTESTSTDTALAATPYYDEDGVTLYCGDARELASSLSASVVLADPDYGVGRRYRSGPLATRESFAADVRFIVDLGLPSIVHLPQSRLSDVPKPQWVGCWMKPGQIGGWMFTIPCWPHWEPLAFYHLPMTMDRRSDVFVCDSAKPNGHPTPKPLSLTTQLLQWLPAGKVLDPFAGSGTTLVAAKNLGRQAIGIEIEERYCEIAVKRLQQGVLAL